MYEAFYGLEEKPFSVPPDPTFLYLSEKHKKALSRLQYSILNHAAFTVITGEIGSGKTTLVRELIHKLDMDVSLGLVSTVNISSFEELMQWILYAFELEYTGKDKVGLFETFTDFVIKNYAKDRRTVLIIDEAQNLDAGTLEQLRMLSNINVDKHQVLQLILVGQPNLRETLKRPELEQFAQRIEVEFFLQPLSLEETTLYVKHRIKVAGGSEDLFLPDTFLLIWKNTGGVPRLINILCGMALVYGFAELKDHIDSEVINLVLKDKADSFKPIVAGLGASNLNAGTINSEFNGLQSTAMGDGYYKNLDSKERKELSTIEKLFLINKD